ncbi:L-lactate permease [Sporichthya brevicatena]|uniref:L-lactate permease n=1 Tax=Sporichthya brevicatena TaxID=171442 RepID=A0ABN1GCN0_9ACTN
MLLATYQPDIRSINDSLTASALIAALPLATLFFLLGVLRITAWVSGLAALAVAWVVAIGGFDMPVDQAAAVSTWGAAFGFFPIMWIVISAIWVYNMTVETGHFDVLRRSFATISDDMRIQAIVIAFCFGALMEALAGFGTPVAISAVMLIALGFPPMKAAVLALVANTAPVAFGALATPVVTLAKVTAPANADPELADHFTEDHLGALVGHQTPVLAVFVPLVLVAIVDGKRGVRQCWLPAAVGGLAFAVAQWLTSTYFSVQLTDVVAALVSALAIVILLRVWRPAETYSEAADDQPTGGSGGTRAAKPEPTGGGTITLEDTRVEIARAYAPYLVIIAIFSIFQIDGVKKEMAKEPWTYLFQWPGLDLVTASGKPPADFTLNWFTAAGTLTIIAGLITMPIIGIKPGAALRAYVKTYQQLWRAIVTVMAVLALAYIMNNSGQTGALGNWLADTGDAFALISPILGWLGVAVTGSDTSSNSLFGALQVTAGQGAGLDPALMAASNSSGGVLGKMISPQNLAIAAGAVGLTGREGDIFRKVVGWSLVLLAGMCLLVFLQTNVLEWMLPEAG